MKEITKSEFFTITHEDDRRILTSIPYKEGEIKIIVAKKDCVLGNHYHKIKTEEFRLVDGVAELLSLIHI
jgi:hypothetical protein